MSKLPDVLRRPPGRFAERSLLGLLLVAGTGVAFGLLLVLVRVGWQPLYAADHGLAQRLNDLVAPVDPLVTVLTALSNLGGHAVLIWLVTVAAVGLLIRRQGRLAAFLIVTGVGALVLGPSVKALVGRLRPVVDVPLGTYQGDSFPSGHALGSVVAYGALLLVFLPAVRRRWRRAAIAVVATVVLLVGLTRVALGVHFLSDVLGGWLLGLTWLGVTAYGYLRWRRERGAPVRSLVNGLEPEAGRQVTPAPDERRLLPRPLANIAQLVAGWAVVFGVLTGFGLLVSYHLGGTFVETVDTVVPRWFADLRTPTLDRLSYWWSKAGDTHAILNVSLVFCPLVVAVWRRWRPVLFLVLTMFGELSLFLATAAVVGRPRPPVGQLDGTLPTSAFPSGHIAATMCLYVAMAVIVLPRTDRWWRWLFVAAAVVMPVGVAVSRIHRGMHHPTDFLGATLLTALWVGLLYLVVRPNADLAEGNRPSIGSEQVGRLDDELVGAATGQPASGAPPSDRPGGAGGSPASSGRAGSPASSGRGGSPIGRG